MLGAAPYSGDDEFGLGDGGGYRAASLFLLMVCRLSSSHGEQLKYGFVRLVFFILTDRMFADSSSGVLNGSTLTIDHIH